MDDESQKGVGCDCYMLWLYVYGKVLYLLYPLDKCTYWLCLKSGWNDATTGPLLPIIQAHYNIGFIVVSMLFVSSCVGYMSAPLVNSKNLLYENVGAIDNTSSSSSN